MDQDNHILIISLHEHATTFMLAVRDRNTLVVLDLSSFSPDQGAGLTEGLDQHLQEFISRQDVAVDETVIVVPESLTPSFFMDAPQKAPPEHLEAIIIRELDTHLKEENINDYFYNVIDVTHLPDQPKTRLLIVYTAKTLINELIKICKKHEINLRYIAPNISVLSMLYQRYFAEKREHTALVDLFQDEFNIYIFRNGHVQFIRTTTMPAYLMSMQNTNKDAGPLLKEIITETQRSLIFYKQTFVKASCEKVIFTGDVTALPNCKEVLAAGLPTEIDLLDMETLDIRNKTTSTSGRIPLLVPAGLAPGDLATDFLKDLGTQHKARKRVLTLHTSIISVILLINLVFLTGITLHRNLLAREVALKQAELAQPEQMEEVKRLQISISAAHSEKRDILKMVEPHKSYLEYFIKAAAFYAPEDAVITNITYETTDAGHEVNLTGNYLCHDAVQGYEEIKRFYAHMRDFPLMDALTYEIFDKTDVAIQQAASKNSLIRLPFGLSGYIRRVEERLTYHIQVTGTRADDEE